MDSRRSSRRLGKQIISHTEATVLTRSMASYVGPTSGDGIEVALLTPSPVTPQAGNTMRIEFNLVGEGSTSDMVFLISRNGTLLADSEDGSSNRWSGITVINYDGNNASTPSQTTVKFFDLDCLGVAST